MAMCVSAPILAQSRLASTRRGFGRGLFAGLLLAGVLAAPGVASAAERGDPAAGASPDTPLPAARRLGAEARAAAARGQPLVLMFSLPGCGYCEQLRRSTYRWLLRDGVPVEQLEMVPGYALQGFDDRPTDGAALAARYGVRLAPTVLFLGPDGREIGERLVGAGVPDFYGAFVDRSLGQARGRLKAGGG